MEPRPFDRGNLARLPCKCRWCWRFNGATAFRPWKRPNPSTTTSHVNTLQWSHGLSTVETLGPALGVAGVVRASMEPRPFDRGNASGTASRFPRITSFNGATAFRPWKLGQTIAISAISKRLQWSHGLSTVETGLLAHNLQAVAVKLQWSHGLSTVETRTDPSSFESRSVWKPACSRITSRQSP